MLETLDQLEGMFVGNNTLDGAIDIALSQVNELGFSTLIYDYSPVATALNGELITPSYVNMRNVPDDMVDLWCHGGFYQRDPVQQMALASAKPFIWSYRRNKNSTALADCLTEKHQPVASYLHDADLISGVTVPIQRTRGDFATCTAIWHGARTTFEKDARQNLSIFALIGHVFHEHAYTLFSKQQRRGNYVHLTPREQECLRYSADGLTAKEIAYRLDRSVPTITQHLQTAANKLGARNRVHAVTLAHHYRLLES